MAVQASTNHKDYLRRAYGDSIEELRLSGEYDAINIKYFELNVY